MKKLINSPDDVIADALKGVEASDGNVRVDHENRVIYRATPKEAGKVAIISGGGSGHEPMHGGFVGVGMLDAACAGQVFTSPTPDQMLEATTVVDNGAGVLHIVKNYTGDIMNFEMAAEMATDAGIATVIVADDVAVQDSLYTAGRRGVGTTVLLEKIVGAAAEEGQDLAAVTALAQKVADNGRSMGMALTSCTVPSAGKPTFDLPEDQIEIGIGIHGEPGRHREPIADAKSVAKQLVDPILHDLDFTGAPVIAMLNGMGGTPQIELYLMYGEVVALLKEAGVEVCRNLVGNYITSLDMAGCSLTLLKADDEMIRLWDAPVKTAGLRWGLTEQHLTLDLLADWLRRYAQIIDENKVFLTDLDSAIGDADHGANMARGTAAVLQHLDQATTIDGLFKKAGMTLVSTVGGTAGPLYGTLLMKMGMASGTVVELTPQEFGKAFRAGLEGLVARGKTELGDKTMVDALSPAIDAFDAAVADGAGLHDAAAAAAQSAAAGRDAATPLVARKGRASYLGERSAGHQDPGATSSTYLFDALVDVIGA